MVTARKNNSQKHNKRAKPSFLLRGKMSLLLSYCLLASVVATWFCGLMVILESVLDDHRESTSTTTTTTNFSCPISSISQLSQSELHPVAGTRHMVTPPDGGRLILVCFHTSKGPINVLLHENWAPKGASRFLEMVSSKYFHQTRVPLFRCTDACQFGLAGDPHATKQFDTTIPDDPLWLPTGKEHRQNDKGVRRYPKGYFTYAGGGPNSRSNQFVVTLQPNLFMGGGSPWEVPLGEVVGDESMETLDRLYTGYGEKGPSQGLLRREGYSRRVQQQWPLLDYITDCRVLEEVVV